MTVFRFTLTIAGADILTESAQEALFEAGCDDAAFGASNGIQTADFDREARDFADAVATAIKAVETSVAGAQVVEVRRQDALAASPG